MGCSSGLGWEDRGSLGPGATRGPASWERDGHSGDSELRRCAVGEALEGSVHRDRSGGACRPQFLVSEAVHEETMPFS